jgi:hypothetical protein
MTFPCPWVWGWWASDPRTGQPVLAAVQLIEHAGGSAVGSTASLTPPPLKLRTAEGGAVGGGALTGRLAVVAASGPVPARACLRKFAELAGCVSSSSLRRALCSYSMGEPYN